MTAEQAEAVRAAVPVVRELDLAVANWTALQWRQEYGEDMPSHELAEYIRTGNVVRILV